MKLLGKRSVAATLVIFLNAAIYGLCFILIVALVFMLTGSNVAVWIGSDGGVSIEGPGPNTSMMIPVSLALESQTHHAEAPALGIANAQLQDIRGSLRFPPRPGPLLVANWLIGVGFLLGVLWLLIQLRALFRTLRDDRPFLQANATRIQRIGWAVIVGEIARATIVFFESHYALTHFLADGLRLEAYPRLNVLALINGVMILVAAEVMRRGVNLSEDQSLTI